MNAPLPPDPYRALGVEPSADAGAIKTAYRKLVLKCHPDKFPDPTLKAQKQEEFQKVQQAYEILGDDDRRKDYDLEVKHKKLKEELAKRGGGVSTSTPAQSRYVNIRTAEPPPGWSPSKHTTSKSSPYKPYSKEFSQSWEHEIPSRSRAYHDDERRARRAASYEKPKREDSRERRKRDEEDRERAARRRERKEREEEAVRKEVRRQQKLNEEARERELMRKERKEREARAEAAKLKEAKEAKKLRERERETRRKQEAEDKARVKSKPYLEHPPYSEEEDDVQRSRAKKSSSSPKKQSDSPSRDKSTKQRERSSPVEAAVGGGEKYQGHLAFAASYMEKIRSKTNKTSPKHTPEVPTYSAAYPDPNEKWAPKRRPSGDGKHAKDEPIIVDAPEPEVQPEVVTPPSHAQQAPPRLQKSHTMPPGYVPQAQTAAPLPPRVPLNRAATMQPEYEYSRPAEKHRSARKRSSFDDDYVQDYYQAPIQTRYHVSSRDSGVPRVIDAKYRDPYTGAGVPFTKVKTTPAYRAENVATSRHYGEEDVLTSEYMHPQYDYRTAAAAR
ncbi:hypothetical protein KVR01_013147 [Diaporthe batatas]|uniref:uncharacterized protein n=1 Tax=Diaporthe batatas TaxID=748121 RepID=UPI001D04EF9C|nr:uncharacterized protein KVR01_013147 [Diaporthe batatas]KAG8156925.1 hypothetical protein KVR01_013147 [Diaporthe batatas]